MNTCSLRPHLPNETSPYFVLFLEDQSRIASLSKLAAILAKSGQSQFLGHSLVDYDYSVIHHYQPGLRSLYQNERVLAETALENGKEDGILRYADIAAGIVLGGKLFNKLVEHLSAAPVDAGFTIDAKYEVC